MTYKIIVDADACPVKAEIRNAASRFDVQVVMVASFDHRLQPEDGVEIVQVDRSDQSVDLYIVNRIQAGDVLVTQDFGLAALALGKKAFALSNRGQLFNDRTMDFFCWNAATSKPSCGAEGSIRKGPERLRIRIVMNFYNL